MLATVNTVGPGTENPRVYLSPIAHPTSNNPAINNSTQTIAGAYPAAAARAAAMIGMPISSRSVITDSG